VCGSTSWWFIVDDEKKDGRVVVPSSGKKVRFSLVQAVQPGFSDIVTCVEWKLNVRTRVQD